MTQEEWLTEYIASAFRGVTLDGGTTIYAAQSRSYYGDPEEVRLGMAAETLDWRRIDADDLFARHDALPFLDALGFRFYIPASMTALLVPHDPSEMLSDSLLFNLTITKRGELMDVPFNVLFTRFQKAAIIRFLKYAAHKPNMFCVHDAQQRLKELRKYT